MKVEGPIIMLRCSAIPRVDEEGRIIVGQGAAINVSWYERRGDTVVLISEIWEFKAPSIWQAM